MHTNKQQHELVIWTISDLFKNIEFDDIQNCIEKIYTKIPPAKLATDSNYIMGNYDYLNYTKIMYVDVCIWLLSEIENIIKKMNKAKMNHFEEKYVYDIGDNHNIVLGLATSIEQYNDPKGLFDSWKQINYSELPFNIVKKIMHTKGYIVESYNNKEHPTKINNDNYYHIGMNCDATPIRTYLLSITIHNKRPRDE